MLLANFAHDDSPVAREDQGRHMREAVAVGTKADCRFKQTIESFDLETCNNRGLIQPHQFPTDGFQTGAKTATPGWNGFTRIFHSARSRRREEADFGRIAPTSAS